MNRGLEKSAGALSMAVAVMLLVAMMLPPPAARLCIAPGNHIAIEGIDSDCCRSHEIIFPAEKDCRDRLDTAGDCGGCTDLPILTFGPETIKASQSASGVPAYEHSIVLDALGFSAFLSARDRTVYRARDHASSSLPLLC